MLRFLGALAAILMVAGCGGAEDPSAPVAGGPEGGGVLHSALTDPTTCEGTFEWSEFIATAAEIEGSPSAYAPSDTRAGSVEVNFNGGHGFDGETNDAPFAAGIVTLRNGASTILEQIQMNRRWGPSLAELDVNGCRPFNGHTQCWIWSPAAVVDGVLSALVPKHTTGSNQGFDDSGQRIEVRGGAHIDFSDGAPSSSEDGSYEFAWKAPKGLATARANLRVHFDGDKNGSMHDNPLVTLLRLNWPGDGPDLLAPGVEIVSKTADGVKVRGKVSDSLAYACENEVDDECDLQTGKSTVSGNTLSWTITNGGVEATILTGLYVGWSPLAGKLKSVLVDGVVVMDQPQAPETTFLDTEWVGGEALRTFAPGQARVVKLVFEKPGPTDSGRYALIAAFEDGCIIEPIPSKPTCEPVQDPDVCTTGHKPFSITFRYSGDGCEASNHQQGSSAPCKGSPVMAQQVRVVAQSKSTFADPKAAIWFDQTITLGDAFTLAATNPSGKSFASNVALFVVAESGAVLQAVTVHTSCSLPLFVGDQFGAFAVESYVNEYAVPTTTCPGGTGPDACEDGKMASLEMRYTGGGCDQSSNGQNPSKYWCEGYPDGAQPVRIVAQSKAELGDPKAKIWFDGIVYVDGYLSIAGPNGGQSTLGGNAYVFVLSPEGEVLQKLVIHTSCSQPLRVGDVFGSLVLEGFTH